jgi:putative methionine-R-sulfoxide reductase with GAF domain
MTTRSGSTSSSDPRARLQPGRRDYTRLIERAQLLAGAPIARAEAMQIAVDLLWESFGGTAPGAREISWIGFYAADPDDAQQMLLVCRRDKPACSPIGLHGACGRCFVSRRALIVTDVAHLGAGYIACDPRDRSEVVLPMLNPDGSCWGVLDGDSHDADAFTTHDAVELTRFLSLLGLTSATPPTIDEIEVV